MRTVSEETTPITSITSVAPREITRVQIARHVTRDRVLDISDLLNLEVKRSKIVLTLVEYDEDLAGKALQTVRFYADVNDFKLVCWDILNQSFSEWIDKQGSPGPNSGEMSARVATINKDVKYRQPYVIKIDNGVGEAMPGGAVRMVNATNSLTLLLPEWDARRLAMTVLDWINCWEVVNFRKRQEAQTIVIPAMTSTAGGAA